MKKLFKLMMFNAPLRAEEGAEGADGGGSDKSADLAAQVAALSAQLEELKKAHSAPANPPSDADKLRAELEAKKQKEAAVARLQEAIKFHWGVADFVSANKDYVGKLAEGLVRTVNEKQFSDEERKAAATKKNLLEDFFSLQENMDAAPAELKPRILAFKALADDEKDKQAADFWDTLTLTVGQKKLKAQVEAAKRARAGHYEETNDLIKDYNAKVFAKASKYTGEKEQTK